MTRHSPCVGICTLDAATGFCLGCGRSGAEVAAWISMSERERDDVWRKLPDRLASLSVCVRLLPWTRDEIGAWVKQTFAAGLGVWLPGAPRAVNFPSSGARALDLSESNDGIVVRAPEASFRLRLNDKVRAFAFRSGGPIVLGLPRARAAIASSSVLQELGADTDAIDEAHRRGRLFDLGAGLKNGRMCIRTGDAALAKSLADQAGRAWRDVMAAIGDHIVAAGPTRVVETALARIEVFAPIFPQEGTHKHLLPEFPESGEEIAADLTLPPFALPVAAFFPRNDCPQEAVSGGPEIADRAEAS